MRLNKLKYNLIRLLIIFIGLLIYRDLSAQIKIEGVIVDENRENMAGASILEIHTSHGVVSDLDGKFSIIISDTSKLQITYIGYYDTVIVASEFKSDTVQMRPMPFDAVGYPMICEDYFNTINIGYYADVTRMPFGLTFYYFKPYMFGKRAMVNTNLTYKTDFESNKDFVLRLGKSDIIKKEKYRLSSTFYFHLRDLTINENHIRINDYELILRNYFFNFLHLSGGIMLRDDFNSNYNIAGIIGIDASIWKTLSHLNADVRLIDKDYEYSIALYQRLAKNIRILSSFQVGLEFNNYFQYNELNMILRYYLR